MTVIKIDEVLFEVRDTAVEFANDWQGFVKVKQ